MKQIVTQIAEISKNTLRFELYGSFSSQPTNVTNAELLDDLGNNNGTITVASFNPIYCQTVSLKKTRK